MAFNPNPGPSAPLFNIQPQSSPGSFGKGLQRQQQSPQASSSFDIIDWYPQFQSCHRYFLDHSQHSAPVQALSAFMNIQLPYQKHPFPILNSASSSPRAGANEMHLRPNPFAGNANAAHAQSVSLIPYIRRLIATGHDTPAILHGFFGDDWVKGIGSLHEVERRNYLFAAKSTSWMEVKQTYDMSPDETIPFLSPLRDASEEEVQSAEAKWSEWLAMQDWMLGPRAPDNLKRGPRVKGEPQD